MDVVQKQGAQNQQAQALDQKMTEEESQSKEFMAWYREAEKVEKLVEREGWVDEKEMWRVDVDREAQLGLMKVPVTPESHKFECKIFGGLYPRVLPSIVRAVVRMLKLKSNDQIEEKRWQDFLSLESHVQDLLNTKGDGERCQDIYLMAKAAHKYSGTKEPLELILRICCILTVNCLTLTDAFLEPLGIALDPVAALLNHSCDPNCVIRFDADMINSDKSKSKSTPILGSISIDVVQPIREGDELTISYIDNTQPRAHRQADLAARYFFTCACSRCSRGSKTPFDRLLVSAESAEASDAKAYATDVLNTSLSREQNLSSLIPTMNSALSRLAQSHTFPIHRFPGAQLRLQLVLALIEIGRWRDATLQSAIIVYRIDPVLYPQQQHHPVRIVSTWRLYRLAQHLLHLLLDQSMAAESNDLSFSGNAQQDWKLLQMTQAVTISSLQFPPRPQRGNVHMPSRSSLDCLLAQALAELQQHAHATSSLEGNKRLFNAALLTDYERDRKGMEERLAQMWNDVIDAALKSEQSGSASRAEIVTGAEIATRAV
ncbi:hypothetical protein DV737_g3454, partial [Chaetothyriales sp. CBS 132003]